MIKYAPIDNNPLNILLSNYNLFSSTVAILDINHLKAPLKVNKR